MSVTVEKLEKSMAKLTIEVSAKDFDKAIDQVYQKQKGRINVPGFRKGKTPRKIIEKMYGTGIFLEDAINNTINSTYPEEAANCEISDEISSNPEIALVQAEAGKPLIYTATVAVKPPVSLGKYKGVEVEKAVIEVTDEEVDARLKSEQEKNAVEKEVTDRPVADGDKVILDFEGFVDGVAFEGGKGEAYPLTIGSGSFIPGFEEKLIGAEIGKEVDVDVTFPENYQAADLAGKDATFKCTVHKITVKELPELNDEFADDVSEFSTLDEFKADIRSKIEEEKKTAANTEKENKVIDAIIADSEIEIPEPMLRTQQEQIVDEFAQRLQRQGLNIDQYFSYMGGSREKMIEDVKDQADKRIRTRLVLEQIVKAENITATEEDFETELGKLADAYGTDIDTVKKIFEGKEKERMMEDIAVQKAVSFVTDNAVEK
ncbi:MAG TPA: trigger factor [Lachnospiraceae bacterium]|nr:trigger factor [Lachnospiraceae bacterium]